ncbi:MAG: hypothetical protein SFX18_01170 [Pirellulales bacterium]|nr:hypothetical protein [Pirellulales bacterium]
MSPTTHVLPLNVTWDDGFDRFFETAPFAKLEAELERSLAELEVRYSFWILPTRGGSTRRGEASVALPGMPHSGDSAESADPKKPR